MEEDRFREIIREELISFFSHHENKLYVAKEFKKILLSDGLKTKITDSCLSIRAQRALAFGGYKIQTFEDLIKYSVTDLLKLQNFGMGTMRHVLNVLRQNDMTLSERGINNNV